MTLHPLAIFEQLLGRGVSAVTVPVMDGPLRPNQLLESAPALIELESVDNLVSVGEGIWASSGDKLFELIQFSGKWSAKEIAHLPHLISCIAHDGAQALAIGLDAGGLAIRGGKHNGKQIAGSPYLTCPTACLFIDSDTLLIANGSSKFRPSQWKHDLMSHGHTGCLCRIDLNTGTQTLLARNLAFPYGVAHKEGSTYYFTESWRSTIAQIDINARSPKPKNVLEELPGYPARLVASAKGGYWLTIFAPRSQIVEFVLSEASYRRRMMAEIEPEYWIAPDLVSGRSYREPLQGGGLKQMGILKPWAPPRSYGLLVQCDAEMNPVRSFHSRADGTNHGITSIAERGDDIFATAKGPGRVLNITNIVTKSEANK